ncbi:MAG: thiol peroxidase [Bacteroides sp.]|nr:thiol peroxidase [Bacteroides sp.]MDD4055328.1 thiol peroxidase [Bacteroides sp.]MDD4719846.1 thiol peroxidase [Bacteroides sp.]
MMNTKFQGAPVQLVGNLLKEGMMAPDFELIKKDLSSLKLSSLKGKKVILNVFPSLDTGVCAASVRKFNELASKMTNTVVLSISKDLPFAQGRFCTTEGIDNVIPLSDFRNPEFGKEYGLLMKDGPLSGLLARAVLVVNEEGKVSYIELVPEITQEPNYDKALEAVK